jgi:uncharacterized protein (TIGR03067 family)
MHRRTLLLALAAVLGLTLAAGAADDDAVKKEVEKFQGSWSAVSLEQDGQRAPAQALTSVKLIFKGDEYIQKMGDRIVERGTQKLDPTKKPKWMDVTVAESAQEDTKGKVQLCIYELEGDTLRICAAAHGSKERPTKFEAPAGTGNLLMVMKRDKR